MRIMHLHGYVVNISRHNKEESAQTILSGKSSTSKLPLSSGYQPTFRYTSVYSNDSATVVSFNASFYDIISICSVKSHIAFSSTILSRAKKVLVISIVGQMNDPFLTLFRILF